MKLKILLALFILATAACAPVILGRGKGEVTSILFVGNSYSFDVPKAFAKICAANGRRVRIEQVTNGGWSLAQHAENEPTLSKIREGHWDIVVLQEQSRIPSYPPANRDKIMFPPLLKLVEEVKAAGATPVLYQTWGRRDGDEFVQNDTSAKMSKRLADGYHAAAKAAGGLVVVPAGDAWAKEIAAGRGDRLFVEDGSHPSAEGNRLTAGVFYNTLFSPVFGTGIAFPRQLP